MRISRVLLRIGICIIIIGLAIFLANLTSTVHGSIRSMSFEVSANGTYIVVTSLQNHPYEIRILVPKHFNGTFYILNPESIKKLTEGTKTPTLEQTLEGPILIDFTPNRRGAYMFLMESKVSEIVSGSIGLVEKEAISQDLLVDSTIIILSGLAIMLMAALSKHLSRHQNERHRIPKRHLHRLRPVNKTENTHKQDRRPQRNHKGMGTKPRRNPNKKRSNKTTQNSHRQEPDRAKPNPSAYNSVEAANAQGNTRKSKPKKYKFMLKRW